MDAQYEADHDEWEKGVAKLESGINKSSSRDLDVLIRAGADRKKLIRLLALTASEDGSEHWKKLIRQRRNALRSLARRMETLSAEARKQAADITFRAQFHFYCFEKGAVLGMKEPTPLREVPGVSFTISGMRALARMYRDEAKQMTQLLRHYGQTDSGLVHLLLCVYLWTRDSTDRRYEVLARLLTDAFEAAGKRDEFSADQLRKIWNRHGKRMLVIWQQLQTERVTEEPVNFPIGTLFGL